MHNTLNRLQNVFGYFTTVAAVTAIAIATTGLFTTPVPSIGSTGLKLQDVQVVKARPQPYSAKKEEVAHIKFDLDIDLSSLFTWNTKQVFLYVTATYPPVSRNAAPSQSIIWDAILPHPLAPKHGNTYSYKSKRRPSSKSRSKTKSKGSEKYDQSSTPGILQLQSQIPKYQITDPSGRLSARSNATLELNWNIQPWVGALQWVNAPSRLPNAVLGTKSSLSWLPTWRILKNSGGRTPDFDLPRVKDRAEALKAAGKEGLNIERGGEANRGRPA